MEINLLGLVAAGTAFLSIWLGHVAVRKIEALTVHLWQPMLAAALAGLALEIAALWMADRAWAAVCGILGITLLWDAFELRRQARRVRTGHAPANPRNPRHAAMLSAAHSRATSLNLLAREPVGRPVDPHEAICLVTRP